MAVLHVWVKQRPKHRDDLMEAGRYQRGMVISVHEDDSHRGKDFLTQDYFIAIDLPGVPRADLEYLSNPMIDDADDANLPRKRFKRIDVDEILKKATITDKKVSPLRADFDVQIKEFGYVRDSRVIG